MRYLVTDALAVYGPIINKGVRIILKGEAASRGFPLLYVRFHSALRCKKSAAPIAKIGKYGR